MLIRTRQPISGCGAKGRSAHDPSIPGATLDASPLSGACGRRAASSWAPRKARLATTSSQQAMMAGKMPPSINLSGSSLKHTSEASPPLWLSPESPGGKHVSRPCPSRTRGGEAVCCFRAAWELAKQGKGV